MRRLVMATIAALLMTGTAIAGVAPAATASSRGGGDWPFRAAG
jgi:hypothetical protein